MSGEKMTEELLTFYKTLKFFVSKGAVLIDDGSRVFKADTLELGKDKDGKPAGFVLSKKIN